MDYIKTKEVLTVQGVKLNPVKVTECCQEFMAEHIYLREKNFSLESAYTNIADIKIFEKNTKETSIESCELRAFNKIDKFLEKVMSATFMLIILYFIINIICLI